MELQANIKLGLDDVVVTYESGEKLFIQVKHTGSDNTLTFGDLVQLKILLRMEVIDIHCWGNLHYQGYQIKIFYLTQLSQQIFLNKA